MLKHVIETQQFDRKMIEELCTMASLMKHHVAHGTTHFLPQRKLFSKATLFTIFYEPSTRTRLSFEQAALYLGIQKCSTEAAGQFSSAIKGETLEDSIRVLAGYGADVIVLRHPEKGAAERAAGIIDKCGKKTCIINAGDGAGQHPTQALLDIYTIKEECKEVDGKHVVFMGDLKHGRTVHSLCYILGKFTGVQITFVAPDLLQIGGEILDYLKRKQVSCTLTEDLHSVLPFADVLYVTRIQKERMSEELYANTKGKYIIGKKELVLMKPDARILHPLPRVDEISTEVDDDPRAAFFRQAENGLYMRMALLVRLLSE